MDNKSLKGRQLEIERLLDAPIELVWEVWTNPEHIKNWWGPNGFTNTISKMEIKEQGAWNLTMHGPDGKDYRNESIFTHIEKYKRIEYDHVSGPKFHATITFEKQGKKTFMAWTMTFESAAVKEQVVKTFGAAEGLKQNVSKLGDYLAKISQTEKTTTTTKI
jgi:uncharacterized protein YndB with AHSA1/START domain